MHNCLKILVKDFNLKHTFKKNAQLTAPSKHHHKYIKINYQIYIT